MKGSSDDEESSSEDDESKIARRSRASRPSDSEWVFFAPFGMEPYLMKDSKSLSLDSSVSEAEDLSV